MKKSFFKFILLFIIVSDLTGFACCQVYIKAYVNKNTIAIDENLNLSVEISGNFSDIEKPTLPSLANFDIYSSGQSQSVRIVNGKISSSVTYRYTLVPRFVGKATIGPVTLSYEGNSYATSPIEVTVLRSALPAKQMPSKTASKANFSQSQSRDVFMTARTDKKNAFVGEQVTLAVRFYYSVSLLGNPDYTPPSVDNFLSEDLPPTTNGVEKIDGREYNYIEVKSALFGVSAGASKVTSAQAMYHIGRDVNLDPFAEDFLAQFFSQDMTGAVSAKAASNPLTVDIKPLPEKGRPDNFGGAVGRYKIKASLDKSELSVGDLANLSVTISGVGNIKTVTSPQLPKVNNLHFYDTVSALDIVKQAYVVGGSKTFKTVISPKSAGKCIIPPVKFSYFDPNLRKYIMVSTLPIEFRVSPFDGKAQVKYTFGGKPTSVTKDISYIKENAGNYKSGFLLKIASLGKLNLISVFIFLVYIIARLAISNRQKLKHKRAYSLAKYCLKRAKRSMQEEKFSEVLDLLSDILNDYLCNKLRCERKITTSRDFIRLIKDKYPKVKKSTLDKVVNFCNHLDMLKYAPISDKTFQGEEELIKDLREILNILERELKR